ncbi:MAG: YiiD C-terminal domain-containing protein [Burkholderiales bacterium]
MTPLELENYLHEHIPLSAAMQLSVIDVSAEQVVLAAPLAHNINHQDTVFGGNASAVAILAAWSMLHTKLAAAGMGARLVHDLHVWAMGTSETAMTAHLVLPEGHADDAFLQNATRQLPDRFEIEHVTIQVMQVPFTKPCAGLAPPSADGFSGGVPTGPAHDQKHGIRMEAISPPSCRVIRDAATRNACAIPVRWRTDSGLTTVSD